ncbi:VWA domain-containing protein [Mesorhizobium sp. NBSH29]|uniref:VWA domain-containing protein n=1 Tax=Mesorhizobium sp. NBSH29 TaxID=2654249 RepID=UPI0018968708|nr:VWA domain-containing protein [Mesorhizobium sp. NBSH29]QPC87637.1 VWA domain-containing protein [Mesorhizobium sp. NBSH29]
MNDRKTSQVTQQKVEKPAPVRSGAGEIEAFVRHARALATVQKDGGRLILALDATMSRQPTWDLACQLQAQMFDATGKAGALNVQLVYFRGLGECRSSKFTDDTAVLKDLMARIECRGGHTQIGKVFSHALTEHKGGKVNAVVFIGDAMEEAVDDLAAKAGALGLRGVPLFLFQEGHDPTTESAFKEFARLSKGAWFRFDRNAAAALAKLLSAVAVFATGGLAALEARDRPEDRLMIEHLRGSNPA